MALSSRDDVLLAGDVGGTKVLLQLASPDRDGLRIRHERRFLAADYPDFATLLADFLHGWDGPGPTVACLGAAGPVQDNRVLLTHRGWSLDGRHLAAQFDIGDVVVLNDFEAMAHGIDALTPDELCPLQSGSPVRQAPRVLMGAGTGLGAAIMVWTADSYQVVPGEPGRTGFAPADPEQAELWSWLYRRFGRVTNKMVLSGQGLVVLYEFLAERAGKAELLPRPLPGAPDPAAAVIQAGLQATDPLAVAALDLFADLLGARAGDLALSVLARSGVYLAGGIAPKIARHLNGGRFVRAFNDKDVFSALVAGIPVYIVLEERLGMLGAARYAWSMLEP